MTTLEKNIQLYFGVPNSELNKISSFFEPLQLKKNDYFLKEGKKSDQLAFVQSGILREFFVKEDKEITKWISTQGYFVVDLAGFLFGQPARWNIQAITDCELYVISRKHYNELNTTVQKWPEIEKLFLAKCFSILEDRVVTLIALSAEDRYHHLFNFNPDLFNQVPLQYIASMLGMTPETCSRIRKKQLL